jgi:hypothetical protein
MSIWEREMKHFGKEVLSIRPYCLVTILLMACAAEAEVFKTSLNGLELGIDKETGSLVYLSSSTTGVMVEASPQSAGLVDLAYPVESFAAMRLASRFSKAHVTQTGAGEVLIRWDQLGASRSNLSLPSGKVSASVSIRAAGDGKSVILTCHIENKSAVPVPQELFPDLWGFKPFAGVQNTRLRLAREVEQPFVGPIKPTDSAPFYVERGWKSYPSGWSSASAGGYYAKNGLRWLDFGGFDGGLSIFQKMWATPGSPTVRTQRTEHDPMSLRMLWEHQANIEPGQSWDSGEFWLTPHRGGWAKGIEVYRDYVKQVNPPREIPRHVRDGIGFQTIWMMQSVETDPAKADFKFKDLPRVAEDARQYGINEVVVWGCCDDSELPIRVRSELGSPEDFAHAIGLAHGLGVNFSLFVSVRIVLTKFAARYGGKQNADSDFTYHYEMIPNMRPYYSKFWDGAYVDVSNELWNQDVLAGLSEWIKRGVPSFTWDVFGDGEASLVKLIAKVRSLARAADPESTFAGESTTSLELDGSVLDYTWNWVDYVDAAPITNVLRSPRLNCDVEDSPLVVKKAFADNLYMNVMPRKLDRPNGTALIGDTPVIASVLKEVAGLRKLFLPYFVDGTFIGDSVLREPTTAFVRGYQMGDKLLVIVLNDQNQSSVVSVRSDLSLWLPSTKAYQVKYYNSAGKLLETTQGQDAQWVSATHLLQPLELAFFEIESRY